jgi:hypothetical protein
VLLEKLSTKTVRSSQADLERVVANFILQLTGSVVRVLEEQHSL